MTPAYYISTQESPVAPHIVTAYIFIVHASTVRLVEDILNPTFQKIPTPKALPLSQNLYKE